MTVFINRNPGGYIGQPAVVTEWRSTRPTGNRVHTFLDPASSPAVDLQGSGLRSGSFRLVFTGKTARADAFACEAGFAVKGTFNLNDTLVPETKMLFVLNGPVELAASSTGAAWLLTVPFQEIPAT